MQTELEQILRKTYPTLYCGRIDHHGSFPIKYNIGCDDGWFCLIDTLSSLIVSHDPYAVATQVKEKYGTLRFYLADCRKERDFIFGLTNMADCLSEIICEQCSEHGSIYSEGWVRVRCDKHKMDYQINEEVIKTAELPFHLKDIGAMWSEMLAILIRQIEMHVKHNKMPPVFFHSVVKREGKLHIDFSGGDKVTEGLVALLIAYANRIDAETGEIRRK